MRSAIGSIKALAPMHSNVFLQYYENIRDKKHSNGTFADPGQERDQLYQTANEENTKLMERTPRHHSERTKVWYGPIGSGDKLMKNAQKRDYLRDTFNLIGLEMEGAGTMNTIPVGVIRGVCNLRRCPEKQRMATIRSSHGRLHMPKHFSTRSNQRSTEGRRRCKSRQP